MDGRWWRRRLAAFGGAWLLAAVFAGAAIERAYAQATPKPAPTAPKPSKFPLTEEEKRQQAHQETFKAFERLKGAYEGKCEVVEIYPQFLKISRARDEFDAAVKKEAETSAEVEKARAELREREADAEAAKRKELSVPVEYQRAADQRVVEAKLKLDKAREEAGQRILREYQTDLEGLERARCPPKTQSMVPSGTPSGEFYVGIEGLKNTGDQRIIESEADTGTVTNRLQRREDPLGVGIVVGYNVAPWNNNIVVGPFASFDYLRQTINHTFAGGTYIGSTTNWVATFGAKAGFAVYPGISVYGLTGLGVLNETLNVNFGGPVTSSNKTVPGFALGGGAEWRPAMLQGWGRPVALFVQYQHTWWDDAKLDRPAASPLFNYNYKRDDDTIRFGFNIYFNGMSAPPPPPRRTTLITK
jgi:opacity protein-like surface antigen